MAERIFRRAHVNPATGMVTDLHMNSWNNGEMIVHTYQPRSVIEDVLDFNKAAQTVKQTNKRVRQIGEVPMSIYEEWKREFKRGAHRNVEWDTFLKMKLNSPEFKFFKTVPGRV